MLKLIKYTEEYKDASQPNCLYRGISENGINLIVGSPGTGKSTLMEYLALHLANRQNSFLGERLLSSKNKILLISLEENDQPKIRRDRMMAQAEQAALSLDCSILINKPQDIPAYLNSDDDWEMFEAVLIRTKPEIVMVDSLTRMFTGVIENSTEASEFMCRLKSIRERLAITFIIIHHLTKQPDDKPLEMMSMAGSRIISQECSCILGLNRLSDGTIYLKDIKNKYSEVSLEVLVIQRVNEYAFEAIKYDQEKSLINQALKGQKSDNRINNDIRKFFIEEILNSEGEVLKTSGLVDFACTKKNISSSYAKYILSKMVEEELLIQPKRGCYKPSDTGFSLLNVQSESIHPVGSS